MPRSHHTLVTQLETEAGCCDSGLSTKPHQHAAIYFFRALILIPKYYRCLLNPKYSNDIPGLSPAGRWFVPILICGHSEWPFKTMYSTSYSSTGPTPWYTLKSWLQENLEAIGCTWRVKQHVTSAEEEREEQGDRKDQECSFVNYTVLSFGKGRNH